MLRFFLICGDIQCTRKSPNTGIGLISDFRSRDQYSKLFVFLCEKCLILLSLEKRDESSSSDAGGQVAKVGGESDKNGKNCRYYLG